MALDGMNLGVGDPSALPMSADAEFNQTELPTMPEGTDGYD